MYRRQEIPLPRVIASVAVMLLATAGSAHAQTQRDAANVAPGPGIGAPIPDFQAADQHGRMQTFASIRGPRGAVIYFHRSADWCIYCKMQLVELEASRAAITRNGYGVAAISFDGPQALKAFAEERSLGFPLLSDAGSRIIRGFGLLDPSVAPDSPAYGVPVHGSLLVDEHGTVRARYFESGQGHASGVTLTRLFTSAYNTHEKVVTHDHVKLRYSASKLAADAGDRLELALEVAPREGAALHADTVAGTRVALTWEMESSAAFDASSVTYPTPVSMQVAGRTVQMYRDALQLVRPVVLTTDRGPLDAATDPSGDLVLNGTLNFQACVADQCYSARTILLRWKVQRAQR